MMQKWIRFKIHRLLLISGLLFSTVGCDQVTKVVARDSLQFTGPHNYFHQLITLVYAENSGAFLSLGAHLDPILRFVIFTLACALILFAGMFFLFRNQNLNKWQIVALSLIVGGGVGNLIDRALRGWVIDFINMGIGDFRTGIFNIADMAIVFGFVLLLIATTRRQSQNN